MDSNYERQSNDIPQTQNNDNYYKSNSIVVVAKDFDDSELGKILSAYERFKKLVRFSELTKTKQDSVIGELSKDMVATKIGLRRPSVWLHCWRGAQPSNWLEIDYTNFDQVKALLRVPPSSIFGDLGVATYDINTALQNIDLSASQKKVLSILRSMGDATLEDVAKEAGCSVAYVNKVLCKTAKKINEYEKLFF